MLFVSTSQQNPQRQVRKCYSGSYESYAVTFVSFVSVSLFQDLVGM